MVLICVAFPHQLEIEPFSTMMYWSPQAVPAGPGSLHRQLHCFWCLSCIQVQFQKTDSKICGTNVEIVLLPDQATTATLPDTNTIIASYSASTATSALTASQYTTSSLTTNITYKTPGRPEIMYCIRVLVTDQTGNWAGFHQILKIKWLQDKMLLKKLKKEGLKTAKRHCIYIWFCYLLPPIRESWTEKGLEYTCKAYTFMLYTMCTKHH